MARAAAAASATGVPVGSVGSVDHAAPTGAPVLPISLVWSEAFIDRFTADVAGVDASSVLRLGRRCVRRWLSRHGGFGFQDWCSWEGGRLVSCIDGGYGPTPPITFVADEPLLIFSAMVAGDHCYTVHGAKPLVFAGPGLSVTVAPVGSTITLWLPVGVHQQGVVGFFRADRFAALFGLEPGDLQHSLEGIGAGLDQPRIQFNSPLGQGASDCVAQAIGSAFVGEARALYLWAKMSELVAWALQGSGAGHDDGRQPELALALAAQREHHRHQPDDLRQDR